MTRCCRVLQWIRTLHSLLSSLSIGCFCVPKYSHTNCAGKVVSLHYPKMRTKASTEDFMRYLYWAAAGITFLINIGYTTQSLTHQYTRNHPSITSCIIQLPNHPCTIPSNTSVYYDEVLTLVVECTIIPVSVLVELLISMYTVKKNCDTKQKYAVADVPP